MRPINDPFVQGHNLKRLRNSAFYGYGVSFLGTMDGERFEERAERARFFSELRGRMGAPSSRHYDQHCFGIDRDVDDRSRRPVMANGRIYPVSLDLEAEK